MKIKVVRVVKICFVVLNFFLRRKHRLCPEAPKALGQALLPILEPIANEIIYASNKTSLWKNTELPTGVQ